MLKLGLSDQSASHISLYNFNVLFGITLHGHYASSDNIYQTHIKRQYKTHSLQIIHLKIFRIVVFANSAVIYQVLHSNHGNHRLYCILFLHRNRILNVIQFSLLECQGPKGPQFKTNYNGKYFVFTHTWGIPLYRDSMNLFA